MAARRQAASVPAETGRHILREAEALIGGAVAVFIALALLSYSAEAPRQNLGGPLGHLLADTALRAVGVGAYLLPVYLALVGVALLRRNTNDLGGSRLGGAVLLVCGVAALAGLLAGGKAVTHGGGWLGGFLGTVLRNLMGAPGAYLVIGVALVLSLVLATGISAFDTVGRLSRFAFDSVRASSSWLLSRLRRRAGLDCLVVAGAGLLARGRHDQPGAARHHRSHGRRRARARSGASRAHCMASGKRTTFDARPATLASAKHAALTL